MRSVFQKDSNIDGYEGRNGWFCCVNFEVWLAIENSGYLVQEFLLVLVYRISRVCFPTSKFFIFLKKSEKLKILTRENQMLMN